MDSLDSTTGGEGRGISVREGLILAILLGLIFLLPIAFSSFSSRAWGEIFWRNPVDISMIEWCGAFLDVFLFFLLVEHYRQTGRKIFIFISSGFLLMGILGFVYALSRPGSESAAWIKGISLLGGSFYFLLGTVARKQTGVDLPRALSWIIIPSLLVALICAWMPFGLKQILPRILSSSGASTIFGELLFWIPGALFFAAAVPWLHDYLKARRREDIIFTVVILIYAQVSLTVSYSRPWGVIWWGWHIGLLLTGIIAALYLLILCLHYSLIWRLLLSMGFAFGLTVIISSSIIQSYFEKKSNDETRRRLSMQQKALISESAGPVLFSAENLQHLVRDFFLQKAQDSNDAVRMLCLKNRADWPKFVLETGFYTAGGALVSSDLESERADFREKALDEFAALAFRNINGKCVMSSFYFDAAKNKWVVAMGLSFRTSDAGKGLFYNVLDVSRLKGKGIVPNASSGKIRNYCGRMVVCSRTGRFIDCSLPSSYVEQFDSRIPQHELPISRKLQGMFPDALGSRGRTVQFSYSGKDFLVFANPMPATDWIVLDIIDDEGRPLISPNTSNHIFEATAMIVFLAGMIVLLFLLNYQIARPLNQLVSATEKVEKGDFSIRINSRDSNEFGKVSKSFDGMVDKLQKTYAELHHSISEKTHALQEAKKANHARTSFFTNISHELRTPLHGILSFSRLGMDPSRAKDEKKVADYFGCINESAQRLLKMINELLDFAKLESGHMELVFTDTSLLMISLQIYNELKANFEEKKVKFTCPRPDFDTNACIDREKIAGVMRNLIGNALKFTEPESELKVTFSRTDKMLSVTVSDMGPGIPESELDIIFDRFFQSEIARVKGGTGLGLSICKEIIRRHNGTIYASNNAAKGASFTFSVPVEHVPDAQDAEKT